MRLTTQCTLRRAVLALRTLAGHCLADSGHLSVRSTRVVLRLDSAYATECLEHTVAFCFLGMLGIHAVYVMYCFQFFPGRWMQVVVARKIDKFRRGLERVDDIQDALPNDSSRGYEHHLPSSHCC